MNELELKEKLHSSLVSKAKINDICENLQEKFLEKNNQYKQVVTLLSELVEVNKMLQSELERVHSELENKRKSYTELEKSYTELESIVIISPEQLKQAEKSIEDTKLLLSSINSMNC